MAELVRLLLSLIIIGGCGMLGRTWGQSLRERPRQLASLRTALTRLETEITYSVTFLPEALESLAQMTPPPVDQLFADVKHYLEEGQESSVQAWWQAIEKARAYLVLTSEDERILMNLGASLGASDRHDQVRHLALARERFKQQEELALAAEQRSGRLYNVLGWAAGAALVLILV